MYNQVGGNFARANDRFLRGEYNGMAISAYSLQVVDASEYAGFVYIRHSNRDYPPIRFERRQMALIPATPEARTQFAGWFFGSLLACMRKPTPDSAAYVAPQRRHADMCARLEATYCQEPTRKKRRLVGAKDSSDEESEEEEERESEETEEEESDGELSGFVVPDDFVEYDS
jgi:hypothetical protein